MGSAERYPFWAGAGEIAPEFVRRLRAAPLDAVELPSGDRAWLAVRYDDVAAVLASRAFTRDLTYPGAPRVAADFDVSDLPGAILNLDPPEHTRVRRLVSGAFTPRLVERQRPRVRAICAELLDGLGNPADLIDAFAFPMPMLVICEMLDVPGTDLDRFRDWSSAYVSLSAHPLEERVAALEQLQEYAREMIRGQRDAPGDGLLGALIRARDEEDRLSEDELVLMTFSLIVAGHEATTAALSRGVFRLLVTGQYADLADDPGRVPAAVEEILRHDPPADAAFLRVATEDVRLPSGTVRAGEAVLAVTSAANQDPAKFDRPDVFDVARPAADHLAFGRGPHYCLGANLARAELQIALTELVTRFPRLRLAVPPGAIEWRTGSLMLGPTTLPVEY
jgi:cytochrome P450